MGQGIGNAISSVGAGAAGYYSDGSKKKPEDE